MNNSNRANISYIAFLIFLYIVIFVDLIIKYIPILGYWDEFIAALALPIWIIKESKKVIKIKKGSYNIWVFAFALCGLLGTAIYKYQPIISATIPDVIVCIKFWLAIYVGRRAFQKIDIDEYGRKIAGHIKFIISVFVALFLLDRVFNIFYGDIRYGFKSTWLFYGIHSYFAGICVFLLAILTMVKGKTKRYWFYAVILLMLMTSTMRSKAFGGVLLFVILYMITYKMNKEINIKSIVFLVMACLTIGWSQIQVYFLSTEERARAVLLKTSLDILKDYFPIGAGYATFASHFSGKVYSPLYTIYGINNVYGLNVQNPAFVSDCFWPMMFAQFGIIGTVCFIVALFYLFKKIQSLKVIDRNNYLAALFIFFYLCVVSLAESAFVHTLSVPYGICLGLCFAQNKERKV